MKFSYNWLQSFFKSPLPDPYKLSGVLGLHIFEVEKIEQEGKDFVLDVDITSNRVTDCSSHLGLAREISSILGRDLDIKPVALKEDDSINVKDFLSVNVKNKRFCPRYTARVMTNIKVSDSPDWLKEKLGVCGIQSINNVVDVANYVMLETGQPLHAFDFDKIDSENSKHPKEIVVRFANEGEKITTLDNQKFVLDKDILVISDTKPNLLAIAGIKGGEIPRIDEKTNTIILESANFEPVVIRKASQKLKLKTDASFRFEHNLNPKITNKAIDRAASLIQELTQGKIAKGVIDFYPQELGPKTIKLDLDYVERLLGTKISRDNILKILKSLSFKIVSSNKFNVIVRVPSFRLDVSIPEDLIEEIGRVYGYDKILPKAPKACLIPAPKNLEIFWEEFSKDVLKENGFTEVYNYSLVSKEKAELCAYNANCLLEIENPLSENQRYLCPSLIPNLLENVKSNFRYFNEIKIFEIGKTFNKKSDLISQKSALKSGFQKRDQEEKGRNIVIEKRSLTGLIANKKENKENFYLIKGVISVLLEKMGITDQWCDEYQPTPEQSKSYIWDLPMCAEIKIGGKEIGFFGEISGKVLKDLKIKGNIILFDIDFDVLQQLASEEQEYNPISPYPSAIRDLSILVPVYTKTIDVLNVINESGGALVRDVDLFDVYEGEELPEKKKNLAFRIVYQAENRTLNTDEIDKLHQKIVDALEQNINWNIRK